MIINKTTDYIHFYHAVNTAPERSPRFIRKTRDEDRGVDRVDISREARDLLRERNSSPLVKAGFRLSLAVGELMMMAERMPDLERRQKVQELRNRTKDGSYDFDGAEKLIAAGKAIAGAM